MRAIAWRTARVTLARARSDADAARRLPLERPDDFNRLVMSFLAE
jgi:hypothetical protein